MAAATKNCITSFLLNVAIDFLCAVDRPKVGDFLTTHLIQKIAGRITYTNRHMIPGFYSADHNPMICWKGSGYEFVQVQEQVVNGTKMYTARLQNKTELLYTAWWYDNGQKRTVNQLAWRWDALKRNTNYSVVNVTAASKEHLDREVKKIQDNNPLK